MNLHEVYLRLTSHPVSQTSSPTPHAAPLRAPPPPGHESAGMEEHRGRDRRFSMENRASFYISTVVCSRVTLRVRLLLNIFSKPSPGQLDKASTGAGCAFGHLTRPPSPPRDPRTVPSKLRASNPARLWARPYSSQRVPCCTTNAASQEQTAFDRTYLAALLLRRSSPAQLSRVLCK